MELIYWILITVVLLAIVFPNIAQRIYKRWVSVIWRKHFTNSATLFDNTYVSSQQYYCQVFGKIPTICFLKNVDTVKAIDYINREYAGGIVNVYQSGFYEPSVRDIETRVTLIRLVGDIVIEVGKDYAEILYDYNFSIRAKELIKVFTGYISQEKKK